MDTAIKKIKKPRKGKPIFEGAEWNFDTLKTVFDEVEKIGLRDLKLDVYPNQIEVITAEQMLDAYTSTGMPLMYRHWSFGKQFAQESMSYRRGMRSLAYELVINSNPCISYVMEENSATMQTLVIAHAAFGHNHFFKNNYLFKQWTNADTILDYLAFAKDYVKECEEKHGVEDVEIILDAAHALMRQGISRHPKTPVSSKPAHIAKRKKSRKLHEEATFDDIYRTVPRAPITAGAAEALAAFAAAEEEGLGLPEENVLYFLEKHAPRLKDWQRELIRIVRILAQYFYPQRQTKMMNEGCATFVHYEIMNTLFDRGLITEGSMLEALHLHSSVVMQPGFDDQRYGGINPYALGFAMMRDIKRICEEPTAEDKDWFPDFAGNGDAMGTLKSAWADYRDESFILQFLSPTVIRDMRFFALHDESDEPEVEVTAIHNEMGYRDVRRRLARFYDASVQDPDIRITDADLSGTRRLTLTHTVRDGRLLSKQECDRTLQHLAQLWGHRVKLLEVDAGTGKTLRELEALPLP
ncbi:MULTISPECIES: SpoVR family protein [Rhodomicrobium]|uniref:SpoVR family protein n=1 Tax=Rhodomicrobium TaxID=1068 RepID=UPI000B4B8978|nr:MULTISPECIES: SpoVR family protein [Rhodomicrobium]